MNLCAIYLDGSQPIQNDPNGKNLDQRQIFLKKVLEHPLGSSQFLISNKKKVVLETEGILPFQSQIEILNPNHVTAGAIASALLPYDRIDDSCAIALLPTNSLVEHKYLSAFMDEMYGSVYDAGVLLVESDNTNFSYVRMFESKIIEFVEKTVVGNLATTGVFFFRNKRVLLECARWAFVNNQTTHNQ